jgi:hypothetical protein
MVDSKSASGQPAAKSTSKSAAGDSAPAQETTAADSAVELPGLQKDRVAAAGRRTDPYDKWDDEDLRREGIARGLTVNEQTRDDLITALEEYDQHGTQGRDAPTGNHPETLRRLADEEAERQRRAHEE